MSYYTTIYPDWDYKKEFPTIEDLDARELEVRNAVDSYWKEITALCFLNVTYDDLDRVRERFKATYSSFINTSKEHTRLAFVRDMFNSMSWGADRPCVSINHFEYNNDYEYGIEESEKELERWEQRLYGLVFSTPSSITPGIDIEGNEVSPLDFISHELVDIRELIDGTIFNLEFSKLCMKYKDTIELG